MINLLLAAVYLVASLSASDAAPGQTVRVYAGCAGVVRLEPQQGLSYGPTHGSSNQQWADVRVLPDALPGLRYVGVECAEARAELHLNVVDAGWAVYVPVARE